MLSALAMTVEAKMIEPIPMSLADLCRAQMEAFYSMEWFSKTTPLPTSKATCRIDPKTNKEVRASASPAASKLLT